MAMHRRLLEIPDLDRCVERLSAAVVSAIFRRDKERVCCVIESTSTRFDVAVMGSGATDAASGAVMEAPTCALTHRTI